MKIAYCQLRENKKKYCVIKETYVTPIEDMVGRKMDTLTEIIDNWSEIKPIIELNTSEFNHISIEKVKFLSPLPFPGRNIICVGKNYIDHAKELESKTATLSGIPTSPIFFSKMVTETIGNFDAILFNPLHTQAVDYEVELAVIIGKRIKNIKEDEAENAIFGYTIGNDITARDIQTKHVQWFKGKSLDTFSPLGPSIITKDTIDFPPKLAIKSYVNGELRQSAYTNDLIFSISKLISTLSMSMTLLPGDIILTGTPAGVGMGFDPPKYLKNGDEVICEIEQIGQLRNRVVTEN